MPSSGQKKVVNDLSHDLSQKGARPGAQGGGGPPPPGQHHRRRGQQLPSLLLRLVQAAEQAQQLGACLLLELFGGELPRRNN